MVMIRMPGKLKRKLEKLAAKDRRPLSDYCRNLLEDHAKGKRN